MGRRSVESLSTVAVSGGRGGDGAVCRDGRAAPISARRSSVKPCPECGSELTTVKTTNIQGKTMISCACPNGHSWLLEPVLTRPFIGAQEDDGEQD